MIAPTTIDEFLAVVRDSGLCDEAALAAEIEKLLDAPLPEPQALADRFVSSGLLTYFQANRLLAGKTTGFDFGKYVILEFLGQGGMGRVYLAHHKLMHRLVALKMLPKKGDPSTIGRFLREARAVAALDHPNIVRAHDMDHHNNVHYMVMEYVDGTDLHGLVETHGPLDVTRAAHYIAQTAQGLRHAHHAGWVHRDIKPSNLLLNRQGTVKILDMGLARLFHDRTDALTKNFDDKTVLGTIDYLSPEQAMNSHDVDIRTDIYSLGATFYFLVTGTPPFGGEGTVAQKLVWHQLKQPQSVRELSPEVPEEMARVLQKMMAKNPAERFQDPQAVVEALAPWTATPIMVPRDEEMPLLCPKVARLRRVEESPSSTSAGTPASMMDTSANQSTMSLATQGAVKTSIAARSNRWFTENASRTREAARPQERRGKTARWGRALIAVGVIGLLVGLGYAVVSSGINRKDSPPADPLPTPAVSESSVLPPENAILFLGKTITVEMKVMSTGVNSDRTKFFLNSRSNYRDADNFAVVAPNLKKASAAELRAIYDGKSIRVTGNVGLFNQHAQIVVADAEQVHIVSESAP
jgi:serine/threonine protein kinase